MLKGQGAFILRTCFYIWISNTLLSQWKQRLGIIDCIDNLILLISLVFKLYINQRVNRSDLLLKAHRLNWFCKVFLSSNYSPKLVLNYYNFVGLFWFACSSYLRVPNSYCEWNLLSEMYPLYIYIMLASLVKGASRKDSLRPLFTRAVVQRDTFERSHCCLIYGWAVMNRDTY